MMNRNSKAPLSPHEVNALRVLKQDSARPISDAERRLLLLSMGLAVNDGEAMQLPDAGRVRLELEERASR